MVRQRFTAAFATAKRSLTPLVAKLLAKLCWFTSSQFDLDACLWQV